MTASPLQAARARIADCLELDAAGQLVQRRDYLNLSGLGLTSGELAARFDPQERGLPVIGLADLPYLRYLDLTGNRLTELPDCVAEFSALVWLGLNFNQLAELPKRIGALRNLQRLYLRGNKLAELPDSIGSLDALLELDLRGNRIVQPPLAVLPLLDEKRECGPLYFDFGDNGGEWSEIVSSAKEGNDQCEALSGYLRKMREPGGSSILAQGKLLFIGEGGVGKTTLLDVLDGKAYNNRSETTHGLELRRLSFSEKEDAWEGTLHAWDFSGQPAMRQTHQLFFTSPALYLLVWNHREAREAETGAEIMEWLTLIDQRTQGEGRVLLVAKKANDRSAEPPKFDEILRRFGPESRKGKGGVLLENGCLKVDSEGPEAEEQVSVLRGRIAAYAAQAPSFNERRPSDWIQAQKHFQSLRDGTAPPQEPRGTAQKDQQYASLPRPYLKWEEFAAECRNKLRIADAEEYARAQDRLGALVWIDTERLRHIDLDHNESARQLVVLNPDWLSKAIGFVIERDEMDRRGSDATASESPTGGPAGLVSILQMDRIWLDPPQAKKGPRLQFASELFPFFRQLMRAYDIARPVRYSGTSKEWYLVPNRLPSSPSESWNEALESDLPRVFWRVELRVENGDPLNHWLGLAIFYRLMIVIHGKVLGRQDFDRAVHWRRGFILAPHGGGLARVEFNGSDRRGTDRCVGFDIAVASQQPREIWSIFAEDLDHIIRDLNHRYGYSSIVVKRRVSCPASLCDREAAFRCYMDEAVVATRAYSGKAGWKEDTTICNGADCGKDLPLGLLWDGRASDDPSRFERMESKLDHILENQDGNAELIGGVFDQLSKTVLGSEADVQRILSGQMKLERSLRETMERASEKLYSDLRAWHQNLTDPMDDLPRLFTLMPVGGWRWPLAKRKWRLRLYCEKTGLPASLDRSDGQGEYIILESQEFLRAVAPYVKRVSTILVALGPVSALLGMADPVIAMTPAIVLAMAEWARAYQRPMGDLASLLKDESSSGRKGMRPTGEEPGLAEQAALLWLHNFIRSDPANQSKLGLQCKLDGQGRRWWVRPDVEV